MKRRLPLKGGDEYDVVVGRGRWRKYLCWTQRPGACKWVKNKINRRERRDGRAEVREQLSDGPA